MPKNNLEKSISTAAEAFALEVVEAIKDATLQELIALQAGEAPKKPGRKPGRPKKAKPGPKTGRKPGRPPKDTKKTTTKSAAKPAAKKKRVAKNYPKCAFPGCKNNRFPRGKGFCGDHWRQWKAKKIKGAAFYVKKQK